MKIKVQREVEAPDDATHYSDDLLDDPIWWKFRERSPLVHGGWYFLNVNNVWHCSPRGNGEDQPPPHVHKIKEINE